MHTWMFVQTNYYRALTIRVLELCEITALTAFVLQHLQ